MIGPRAPGTSGSAGNGPGSVPAFGTGSEFGGSVGSGAGPGSGPGSGTGAGEGVGPASSSCGSAPSVLSPAVVTRAEPSLPAGVDSDSEDGATVDLGSEPLQEAPIMVTTSASKIREAFDL